MLYACPKILPTPTRSPGGGEEKQQGPGLETGMGVGVQASSSSPQSMHQLFLTNALSQGPSAPGPGLYCQMLANQVTSHASYAAT